MNRNQEIHSFWILGVTPSQNKKGNSEQGESLFCHILSLSVLQERTCTDTQSWALTSASSEDFSCLDNKNKALELYWVSGHYLTLKFDDLTWPCLSQDSLAHPCSAHADTEAL